MSDEPDRPTDDAERTEDVRYAPDGSRMVRVAKGGWLRSGGKMGNKGGGRRPKNVVRQALVRMADENTVPFLRSALTDGVVVAMVERCRKCGHTEPKDSAYAHRLIKTLGRELDDKFRAAELTLKFGLGTQVETVSKGELDDYARGIADRLVDALLAEGYDRATISRILTRTLGDTGEDATAGDDDDAA